MLTMQIFGWNCDLRLKVLLGMFFGEGFIELENSNLDKNEQ